MCIVHGAAAFYEWPRRFGCLFRYDKCYCTAVPLTARHEVNGHGARVDHTVFTAKPKPLPSWFCWKRRPELDRKRMKSMDASTLILSVRMKWHVSETPLTQLDVETGDTREQSLTYGREELSATNNRSSKRSIQ